MAATLSFEESKVIGTWQAPENIWQNAPNSIHNDEVAHKVGMRGGTIPGTIHLDHFRPIIEELWGDKWWTQSSISMYYTFATTHREEVRAVVVLPEDRSTVKSDCQVDAYVENTDGRLVCKGTLAVGANAEPGYVQALELPESRGEQRILADLAVGDVIEPQNGEFVEKGEDGVLRNITDHYSVLNSSFPPNKVKLPAVGFFGATEIRLLQGPLEVGTSYERSGKVVAVGESAKTEFAWVDSTLKTDDGKVVAEMRHMTRFMKVSSALWNPSDS